MSNFEEPPPSVLPCGNTTLSNPLIILYLEMVKVTPFNKPNP